MLIDFLIVLLVALGLLVGVFILLFLLYLFYLLMESKYSGIFWLITFLVGLFIIAYQVALYLNFIS